jgi:sugar lactone lactonase YvrE
VTFALDAAAAAPVRVSLVGKSPSPVAGRAWTARLAVRPVSFGGSIRITATGPERIKVRATGGHGSYRARLVFPSAGRWTLAARAGGSTSPLGSVQVRPSPPRPVAFTEPTSIDLEPAGTLLLVENNPGRVLRLDPASGRITVLVPSAVKPYAIVRAPSGVIFFSADNTLRRLDANGTLTTLPTGDVQIGPVAAAPNGDVYFTTGTQIFRLAGGAGTPVRIAGTGVEGGGGDGGPAVNAQLSSPHGLAIAADGAVLVCDAGNNRVRRIDPATGMITALAQVGSPRGIDIAADGTIYVVDSVEKRLLRLSPSGARIGFLGASFGDPYDVEVADSGVAYVLEAGPTGWVRRVAADGTVTTVSRG